MNDNISMNNAFHEVSVLWEKYKENENKMNKN